MQHYARKISVFLLSGAVLIGLSSGVCAQTTTGMPDSPETTKPSTRTPAQSPSDPYSPSTPAPVSPANPSGSPTAAPATQSPSARAIDLNVVTAPQLVKAGLDEPSAKLIVENRPYSRPEEVLEIKELPEQTKSVLKANMRLLKASTPAK
ncbi:MAG: hypothetical protein H7Y22_08560 [Gemmatimonadaceae bacterium]|nr:hypothetical protein [Gloeobacterales cyanobacterium ES-bin-141]